MRVNQIISTCSLVICCFAQLYFAVFNDWFVLNLMHSGKIRIYIVKIGKFYFTNLGDCG